MILINSLLSEEIIFCFVEINSGVWNGLKSKKNHVRKE